MFAIVCTDDDVDNLINSSIFPPSLTVMSDFRTTFKEPELEGRFLSLRRRIITNRVLKFQYASSTRGIMRDIIKTATFLYHST